MQSARRHTAPSITIAALLAALPGALAAQMTAPATGLAISVRTHGSSIQDLTSSTAGGQQFTIGHRGQTYSVGLGIGFITARLSDKSSFNGQVTDEEKNSATAFQVGPVLRLDTWRSTDQRTVGNVTLGVGVGRVSLTEEDTFIDFNGNPVSSKSTTSGTLLGLNAALGGDHFLSPHFALGLEAGFMGTFALGIEEEGGGERLSAGASGAYGALRATLVF